MTNYDTHHLTFLLQMANYDFYQRLEQQCCAKLEHFEMSVFKPSTTEVRPAEVAVQTSTAFVDEPESPTVVRKDSSKFDLAFGMSGGSFALSLGEFNICIIRGV